MPNKKVIVIFKDHTPDQEIESAKEMIISEGGVITHCYSIGFAAEVTDNRIEILYGHPCVDSIELDGEVQ
ncbi:hypothetical protein BGZ76_011897 [Entomortierella beljakovae]|nr:hypothetical protein BGZ76_011897 [Entomortierella beljakovae]